jgi:hypothetical protein
MRRARRAVHDLALADDDDLLVAVGRPAMQVHVAADHVPDLVARVAVELTAKLATACDEGNAVGRLPQHGVRPARMLLMT